MATINSLTRSHQRLAKEALTLNDEMAGQLGDLVEKIKRGQQHQFQLDAVAQHDAQQNQQQNSGQNGNNFEEGN